MVYTTTRPLTCSLRSLGSQRSGGSQRQHLWISHNAPAGPTDPRPLQPVTEEWGTLGHFCPMQDSFSRPHALDSISPAKAFSESAFQWEAPSDQLFPPSLLPGVREHHSLSSPTPAPSFVLLVFSPQIPLMPPPAWCLLLEALRVTCHHSRMSSQITVRVRATILCRHPFKKILKN